MANSNFPTGLANQVSSESLDTFLLNLSSSPADLEDFAMNQSSDSVEAALAPEKSRHSNVKQPATMPSTPSVNGIQRENTNTIDIDHRSEDQLDAKNPNDTNGTGTNAGTEPNFHRSTSVQTATVATAVSAAQAISGTVPEFLYQLFKMLTDNNREVIEWADGKIKVHSPIRLQNEILHNYFRHSKFASFQRQLNYFGFRKLAGKGKMSPCSYVNDSIGDDLNRLMLIKRKTGPAGAKDGRKTRKHSLTSTNTQSNEAEPRNTQSGRLRRRSSRTTAPSTSSGMPPPPALLSERSSASVLARQAVGKGVRHNVTSSAGLPRTLPSSSQPSLSSTTMPPPQANNAAINQSLSELESNYRSSLEPSTNADDEEMPNEEFFGFLSRNSSLVDLAMIPPVDENFGDLSMGTDTFNFVDFPNPEVDPLACLNSGNEEYEGNESG